MQVSPYQPDIIHHNYQPFEWNLDLVSKVLAAKEQQYEQNYQGLNNLRKTALSINFLNKGEQSKVDQFNQKVDQLFSSEMGDLSDPNIVSKYTTIFKDLASQPNLMNRYREDLRWQNELKTIQELKSKADPKKAGYFPVNEAAWLHKLNNYASSNLDVESPSFESYTPYVDRMPRIINGIKSLKPRKQIVDTPDGRGNIIRTVTEGYDPAELNSVISLALNDASSQLQVEAYYRYLTGGDNKDNELFNRYHANLNSEKQKNDDNLNNIKSEIAIAKAKGDTATVNNLTEMLNKIEARNQDIFKEQALGLENFVSKSEDEKVAYLAELLTQQELSSFVDMYKPTESREIKTDQNYWNAANYQLNTARLNQQALNDERNYQLDLEELKLEQAKTQAKTQDNTGTGNTGNTGNVIGGNVPSFNATGITGSDNQLEDENKIRSFEAQVMFNTTNFTNGQNYNIPLPDGTPANNDDHLRNMLFGKIEGQYKAYGNNPSYKLIRMFRERYMDDIEEELERNQIVSQEDKVNFIMNKAKEYVGKFYQARNAGVVPLQISLEEEAIYNEIVDNDMVYNAWQNLKTKAWNENGQTTEGQTKGIIGSNIARVFNGNRVFFETPDGTDTKTKASLASERTRVANIVTNNITDRSGTQLINPEWIAGIETYPNGKMKVYFTNPKGKLDGDTFTPSESRPQIMIGNQKVTLDGSTPVEIDVPEYSNPNLVKDMAYMLSEGIRYKYNHLGVPYTIKWAGTDTGQPRTIVQIGNNPVAEYNKTPMEVRELVHRYIESTKKQ